MASTKPKAKIKLSWLDILFRSLSVVIPVLLESLVEVVNNPDIKIEEKDTTSVLSPAQKRPSK